jgi:diguanylate cyclase (GGDEF)-like protein
MPGGGLVATYTDITERRRSERRISQLALQDGLTGLANRNLFLRRLEDAVELAKRNEMLVGVGLIDLDRFKNVNDSFGHAVGDKLLTQVGDRLREIMRTTDTVARLGGDEFAVIMANIDDPNMAIRPARRIIESLAAPFEIDDLTLNVGGSIGITFFPNDAETPEELIRKADLALYEAKGSGRGMFHMFDEVLDQRAQAQRRVEEDLRRALVRDEFQLFYQPIVSLPDRAVVGAEALIRWEHPTRGLLSPIAFIPVAEVSGLILPIGDWVLREACRQAREWLDAGLPPLRVAVNIAAPQFQGDSLVNTVRSALADAALPPSQLEIEINESMMMGDTAHATAQLQKLADLGVSLAIDDFGTGYSSLAYLKTFPVHRLKIDRSFVHNVIADPADAAITETVVHLAKSLNLKVVAEGVESEAHVAYLLGTHCDEVQGFHFSRPVPSDTFIEWMRNREAA